MHLPSRNQARQLPRQSSNPPTPLPFTIPTPQLTIPQETSSQKQLLAPEFNTIKMMESFGAKNLRRLRSRGIKDGLATKEDWAIVKKQERQFEVQVAVSVEILDSLIWMREVYLVRSTFPPFPPSTFNRIINRSC